eukprot:170290-Amphidinium_carterae.1
MVCTTNRCLSSCPRKERPKQDKSHGLPPMICQLRAAWQEERILRWRQQCAASSTLRGGAKLRPAVVGL